MRNSSISTATEQCRIVPERQRMRFLPAWFGKHYLVGESLIYAYAQRLSGDYSGGIWKFYEGENGVRFMAPSSSRERFACAWPANWFEGALSPQAFGIVASLFALGHVAGKTRDERVIDAFHALREFACDHPEAAQILAAID